MIHEQEAQAAAPSRSDWVRVDVVTDPAVFAAMREEWSALLEESSAGIFNGWDWLYPFHRRVDAGSTPYILTARDRAGRLVGLMPLCIQRLRVATRPVRKVCFIGDEFVGSDYLDVVAVRGREEELARVFAKELFSRQADWDLLDLVDFDERSKTPEILRETFRTAEFETRSHECCLCPNEELLPGETFEVFLKRTKRRDNFLRRKKWLEKQPGYRIEIETDPKKLVRPLSEFFRLHAARWESDGGSQGITGPRIEAFHRDATHLLAEKGKLRMYTMWVGEEAVATVYGIVHGDKFHYYQSGYAPEWRNKSVGLVLVGATFEDAIKLGVREYDFLRGTETYKSDWVSRLRKTVGVRFFAKQGAGAWFVKAEDATRELKAVVKRLLPKDAVQRIQRLRRRQAANAEPVAVAAE